MIFLCFCSKIKDTKGSEIHMKLFIFLGFINVINEYFESFRNNPLISLIPFIFGIIIGFAVCFLLYLLVIVSSLKKTEKIASSQVFDVDDEIINNLISNAKNKYIEEASTANTNTKIESLKYICSDLLNDIAKTYYPKSKFPLYELSIDEFLRLVSYIQNRVDSLFKGKILKNIYIEFWGFDLKKKIDESAAYKAANKVASKASVVWSALNILNPAYWIKKIAIDRTFNVIINKIATTVIDIVGDEGNKVYSKNVFVTEQTEDELQKEIEGIIKGEYNE